jgi:hypothetical protein
MEFLSMNRFGGAFYTPTCHELALESGSPLLGAAVPNQGAVHDIAVGHGRGIELDVTNRDVLAQIADRIIQALLKNLLVGCGNQFELNHAPDYAAKNAPTPCKIGACSVLIKVRGLTGFAPGILH